jgi:hypothetical protein
MPLAFNASIGNARLQKRQFRQGSRPWQWPLTLQSSHQALSSDYPRLADCGQGNGQPDGRISTLQSLKLPMDVR